MRNLVSLYPLLLVLLTGCAGDKGEWCGLGSRGCMAGLYCHSASKDGGDGADGNACESIGTINIPDDGVCRPIKDVDEPCQGFWRECGRAMRCVQGRCMVGQLGNPAPGEVEICSEE